MHTPVTRTLTWIGFGLAFVGLVWCNVGVCGERGETLLLKVTWSNEAELNSLESRGATLRYCHRDWAIVEAPGRDLESLGLSEEKFSVVDTLRAGTRYWLVHLTEVSSRDSVAVYGKLCPLDGRTLFLLRTNETLEEHVSPWVFSGVLLPEKATCRGHRPRAAPSGLKVAADAGAPLDEARRRLLASVSGDVSADSIRAIVHFLSVDDSSGALRSRYTFRDETLEMAHLLRERLREALGGQGEDSLHVFVFRYGGIDYYLPNVVARFPGQKVGKGTFVLCAHFDSQGGRTVYEDPERRWNWRTDPAPGADDNGSGVASVLECARVLSQLEFDFDIEFVLFCAEEQGLFGSRAYASEHELMDPNILGVLNFDMHAFRESAESTFVRTNTSSEWLSNHVRRISEELYDTIGLRVGLTPVETLFDASDHASFWMSGFDAVHFFEHSSLHIPNPYYHTVHDTEEKLNYELSCKVAKLAAASMAYFATTSDPWDLQVLAGDLVFSVEGEPSYASEATVGQTVRIVPSFHNVGGRAPDTLSASITVYDGDPSSGGWLIGQRWVSGAVPSGGTVPLAPFYWLLEEDDVGVHSIYIVVDCGESEQNRTNNVASRTFGVSSASLKIAESFVFPNPTRGALEAATLRFSLTRDAEAVQVDVYDISGQRVAGCRDASCGDRAFPPSLGPNEVSLCEILRDGALAPGVYFYKLRVDGGEDNVQFFGKFALVR